MSNLNMKIIATFKDNEAVVKRYNGSTLMQKDVLDKTKNRIKTSYFHNNDMNPLSVTEFKYINEFLPNPVPAEISYKNRQPHLPGTCGKFLKISKITLLKSYVPQKG